MIDASTPAPMISTDVVCAAKFHAGEASALFSAYKPGGMKSRRGFFDVGEIEPSADRSANALSKAGAQLLTPLGSAPQSVTKLITPASVLMSIASRTVTWPPPTMP